MKVTGRTDKGRGLLRTHLWLVLLATCVAVGAAVAAAAAKPLTYTATAEVVVSPQKTKSTPLLPDMGTESAIARSGVVVQRGADALQVDENTVRASLSVTNVLNSRVLRISYTASTAEAAFHGAGVLATSYVDYRNGQSADHAATLVTPPVPPASGSRGNLRLFVILGLVAGLTVGVAAAWLWDRVSDRVRSAAELQQLTGLPILGRMHRWRSTRSALPPEGPARECFAFVAARLTSMTGHGGGKTILITSPRTGAGTSTLACGTAAALAAQGKRVVLIAASPGGPALEKVLGVTASPGLSKLLALGCSPELALHPTDVRNLSVVRMGGALRAGLELHDVHLVLERLERRAFVVIDAPPVLTSADSLLLADASDLVVLVGDLRSGTRTDAREALALLDDVGPRLVGWVANRPPRRRHRRRQVEVPVTAQAEPSVSTAGTLGEAAEPIRPPAAPLSGATDDEPAPPVTAAQTAPPRRGRKPLDAPMRATPARGGVRRFRVPAAAARRR